MPSTKGVDHIHTQKGTGKAGLPAHTRAPPAILIYVVYGVQVSNEHHQPTVFVRQPGLATHELNEATLCLYSVMLAFETWEARPSHPVHPHYANNSSLLCLYVSSKATPISVPIHLLPVNYVRSSSGKHHATSQAVLSTTAPPNAHSRAVTDAVATRSMQASADQ